MRTAQRWVLLISVLICSAFANAASPLENSYKLYESEEQALKAIAGTPRHVLILFSDYSN